MASLGEEETARKASAVISIFDDSSPENSQDDEQFKARKEFLMSGLPESFRKQIAKTDASRETYSLSCSSFQPVIHIKQSSNGELTIFIEIHKCWHLHVDSGGKHYNMLVHLFDNLNLYVKLHTKKYNKSYILI